MTWQEALAHYLQTHSTIDERNRQWLLDHVVGVEVLIKDMDHGQITSIFSGPTSLNHARLVRTLVWQSAGLILAGREEPLEGNLRSFWYKFADPIYTRNGFYQELSLRDPDFAAYLIELEADRQGLVGDLVRSNQVKKRYVVKLCENILQEFVEQRIFRYQGPFQFADPNAGKALLGTGRASYVFVTEKEGLFKLCQRYHKAHRISAMASRGVPSLISAEYFGDQLRSKGITRVTLACLVDYDPAGFIIADTYRQHFEQLGFGIRSFTLLTTLDLFTEATLAKDYEDLTTVHPSREEITQKWFAKTGGIHGKRYGVHVNLAVRGRIHKAVKAWYDHQVERFSESD